jgi:cation transport regulator
MSAFNNAREEYKDSAKRASDDSQEGVAGKVAWTAVKKLYKKDENSGFWKRKKSKVMA